MTAPIVWGLLPKAQDNPATIDSDISAAIAAHNADPNAHNSAGQSLDVHRVNAVIDHPAGSILADKISSNTLYTRIDFQSLSDWVVVGGVNLAVPTVYLYVTGVVGDVSSLASTSYDTYFSINFSLNPIFQVSVSVDDFTLGTMMWAFGSYNLDQGDVTFGFSVEAGVLYGFLLIGGTFHKVVLPAQDWNMHVYRCYCDPSTHDAIFMIDGVVVGTVSAADYYASALNMEVPIEYVQFSLKDTTTSFTGFTIGQLITGNTPA